MKVKEYRKIHRKRGNKIGTIHLRREGEKREIIRGKKINKGYKARRKDKHVKKRWKSI